MKIALNKCYGGFRLSPIAIKEYLKLKGKECFFYKKDYETKLFNKISIEKATGFSQILTKDFGDTIKDGRKVSEDNYFYDYDIERDDTDLIKVIEMLGENIASGEFAEINIVEIPDGISWELDDYDGIESIHETHRSW